MPADCDQRSAQIACACDSTSALPILRAFATRECGSHPADRSVSSDPLLQGFFRYLRAPEFLWDPPESPQKCQLRRRLTDELVDCAAHRPEVRRQVVQPLDRHRLSEPIDDALTGPGAREQRSRTTKANVLIDGVVTQVQTGHRASTPAQVVARSRVRRGRAISAIWAKQTEADDPSTPRGMQKPRRMLHPHGLQPGARATSRARRQRISSSFLADSMRPPLRRNGGLCSL